MSSSLPKVQIFCEIEGCKNSKKQAKFVERDGSENIQFFPYPVEPILAMQWKNACGILRVRSAFAHVCSDHFEPDEMIYNEKLKKTVLVEGSIPRINIPKEISSTPNSSSNVTVSSTKPFPVKLVTPVKAVTPSQFRNGVKPVNSVKIAPVNINPANQKYLSKILEQQQQIQHLKVLDKTTKWKLTDYERISEINKKLYRNLAEVNQKLNNMEDYRKERDYFIKKNIEKDQKIAALREHHTEEIDVLTSRIEALENQLACANIKSRYEKNITETEQRLKVDEILEKQKLRKANKCLKIENENLKQALKEDTGKDQYLLTKVKKIFTKSQIRILSGSTSITWTEQDLDNAKELYSFGVGAYEYLISKGFPFPKVSVITAQSHNKNLLSKKRQQEDNNNTDDTVKKARTELDFEDFESSSDVNEPSYEPDKMESGDEAENNEAINIKQEMDEEYNDVLEFEIKEEID